MHILVIDGDGLLTGTPEPVVEKFLDVSKASDAKSPQGDNIYYKDVIKSQSQYLLWGSHETGEVYDKDVNASGGLVYQVSIESLTLSSLLYQSMI